MPSKGVTDRQKVAKSIVAAARTHAGEVAVNLQRRLTPLLREGQTLPDFESLQDLLARYLEETTEAIIAAEEKHFREQDDDLRPRRQRDEAAQALHGTLVRIRETLAAAYGPEQFRELAGIREGTADEPVTLVRQARRVLDRLRDPAPDLPTQPLEGVQVDLQRLAEQLQPALDSLTEAIALVDLEQRKSESTLRDKDLALDTFDEAVAGAGRILIGSNILAGLREYADRVRLTVPNRRRRSGGVDEGPDEVLPSVPQAPDDPGVSIEPEGTIPPAEEPSAATG